MPYRLYRGLLAVLFRVIWRPVVEGVENIPSDGPVIIAANHLSFIDSIVLPLSVPGRRVTFLAKSEYFTDGGLLAWPRRLLFRALGAVPVQRDAQRQAQASLDTALEVLHRGWAFGIYPEGTRSRDGRLYRGRTGVGWLALQAPAPVVPVGLIGTDRVQPIGSKRLRLHRVHVRFGTPIRPEDFVGERSPGLARRQLTDAVMTAVAELSGQEQAGAYNERGSSDF